MPAPGALGCQKYEKHIFRAAAINYFLPNPSNNPSISREIKHTSTPLWLKSFSCESSTFSQLGNLFFIHQKLFPKYFCSTKKANTHLNLKYLLRDELSGPLQHHNKGFSLFPQTARSKLIPKDLN